MEYLKIKSWEKFQHYKDDRPLKWIKVYSSLLMDYKFEQLSDAEFGQIVKIWLLASQLDNDIPNDPAWIQKKTSMSTKPNINKMIQLDFIEPYESVRDSTKWLLREEESREEKRKEYTPSFLKFWKAYPKKTKKTLAFKTWQKLNSKRPEIDTLIEAIETQKTWRKRESGFNRFVPEWQDPERWLKNERWEDEINGEQEPGNADVNDFLRGMGEENNG